jgi:hypothetical protein
MAQDNFFVAHGPYHLLMKMKKDETSAVTPGIGPTAKAQEFPFISSRPDTPTLFSPLAGG